MPFRFPLNMKALFIMLSGIIIMIVGLHIFQDFWESKRSGYTFSFSESLLFKSIWFLYIPILMVLYQKIRNTGLQHFTKTAIFIVFPIIIHLTILPCIASIVSLLFYQGRYDLFKFFSYIMTHDFYTMVLVYTGFVLGYQYLSNRKQEVTPTEKTCTSDTLVINNGRDNVIINIENIIQITSATPYVAIHLEHRKYLHSETLKSIHEQLGHTVFIRVHKSALVNLSQVRSFKSRLNGDYDLQMAEGSTVRLSRTYAAEFKRRFTTGASGQAINSSG